MTKNEIDELYEIVSSYRKIDGELNSIQAKIEELKKRHCELTKELDEIQNRETAFIGAMKEKYGYVDYNEYAKYIADMP